MQEALFDFRVGYIGTAFLAVCFLLLGTLVMYTAAVKLSQPEVRHLQAN